MKNRSVLNSPRLLELKKKKHKILRRKIFFLICFFILILVGLSFLSKWEYININNIQITGNKVIETKMIESVIKEKITGNYLWFFPKTNFLLYPRGEIKRELADKFKRLKDISLNVQNFKTLNISLTERTALYTYCGLAPAELDASNQKCYFMDDGGYIFDEAPYFSGEVYLKFYGKSDSYFFQPNFSKLISFKETLQKIGVKPVVFFVEDNGDMKVFLSSTTSQLGPFINLKADADFNQIVENLQSVLTTEPLKTEFKTKYSSLLYIDLRFGNKVYYKFR
ncbi:MAG: hypothetical protein NT161_03655 [Candidatus Nomurabacteria bacterium]|nr:hypothetical protein [Candidatus Nomurabacteria bacterium]